MATTVIKLMLKTLILLPNNIVHLTPVCKPLTQ